MSNPSETTLGDASPNRPGILRNPSHHIQQQPQQHSLHQQETVISGLNEKQELDEDESEENSSEHGTYEDAVSGRWGEGPSKVNVIAAEKDFKKLERQLTRRSSLYR